MQPRPRGARRVAPARPRWRVRWALALTAVVLVGVRLASQQQAIAELSFDDACDVDALEWGYEVDVIDAVEGFGVVGVRFESVPAGCDGREVEVSFYDEDESVATVEGQIGLGTVVQAPAPPAGVVPDEAVLVLRPRVRSGDVEADGG